MSGRRHRNYAYVKSNGRPLIRFRFKVVFVIFVIVTAICFFIYMTGLNIGIGDSPQTEKTIMASESSSEQETTTASVSNEIINPVPLSDALNETYFGSCAFVGDSITVGLADYQLVPVTNVYAEVGMNIERINTDSIKTSDGEMTVLDALKKSKPENIYIMLGSNGIAWLSNEDMMTYYKQFVDSIIAELPDSEIYIVAIPPVTQEREKASDEPIMNSDIDSYNSELLKMANENEIYYIDLNTALKGNDGKFPEDYAAEDGMHFKKSTYSIMLDYILTHVAK